MNKIHVHRRSDWQQQVVPLLMFLGGIGLTSLGGCSTTTPPSTAQTQQPKTSTAVSQTTQEQSPIVSSSADPNFVVAVVQKVGPAVVRIDASRTISQRVPDEYDDPFFRRFFGEAPTQPRERVERGSGSGFIINGNGQILTNSHVVNGADKVTVTLKDGREFQGKVLGEDPVTDVAVIKIDANNLPSVNLANSDNLQPGEAVIAIGNPLGLNNTVTSGILSATGRSSSDIGASDKRVEYLQTDAAINPGNSGGPLLNARGDVIGMNTAIIRGAQGLGFAIPINTAKRISEQLITKGKVDHPYLGIQMTALTPELKQRLNSEFGDKINVSADKGVLLVRVVPSSPAAQAGLRAGDIITSINNKPVNKPDEVQKIVESISIGTTLQLQVERNGQVAQLSVKPAPLPVQRER
ncbi:MAG: HhoA/HhoB/HtrA family serine endopeptidase [Nostocaceae cyanobacterium]|nr:HhoA/HhoB/HtrA family serine endopeptidase [Nostocaceae cyanobacterium]